ncbi:MAG: efflux RND transporter periplasmic adaptor subunit [Gammaproteobacteria bacterium]|nr:efflux RND transporter periplasmic adaptor subunit [Gammaproteobacteria bacterium]
MRRPPEGTVVVKAASVTQDLSAFAQVRPIAPVRVRAAQAGTVVATPILPGAFVRAGEVLARLGGAQIDALMARKEAAVDAARARFATDQQLLTIARQRFELNLDTRQSLLVAQSDEAAAKADLAAVTAALRAVRRLRDLRAPAAGRVLSIEAGDGERVSAGRTVLVLQSTDRLWLQASYYGADATAIRIGMNGEFQPSAVVSPVRVRVVAIAASLEPDGGEVVGLVESGRAASRVHLSARPTVPWIDGERGTVTIDAGKRSMVVVPTDALVLDRTHWFALVQTSTGIDRREVVPGPVRGWQTYVEQGLKPGERVVAQNAYLEFHHGIAAHYTPPD